MSSAAECAAYLRKYNEWRRGDPEDNRESEMPHPREIGLHIDFAADVLDAMSGHDHLMVIAATRYCLGRMSYIVSDCADWLIKFRRADLVDAANTEMVNIEMDRLGLKDAA